MGLFGKLFGGGQPDVPKILDKIIQCLRIGIFSYLFKSKYLPVFGEEEAKFWAVAVLNTIILEEPGNEQARVFYERNKEKMGLRVLVWVNLYLLEHRGKDFQSKIFLIS